MEKSPLSDLSFFRFPELTPEVVRDIVILVILLSLTILLTVLAQLWIQQWARSRRRRRSFDRISSERHMDPPVRAVLSRLLRFSGLKDEFELVRDAHAFEAAVERLVTEGSEEELVDLATLRRTLHLNVMNPELDLVSSRQLLRDLRVRLVATIGAEKLDLYCGLFGVSEEYLLINLPYQKEIYRMLSEHPRVVLLYWREQEGEALFRVTLEPIDEKDFQAVRARHAFRDTQSEHRAAFRLSVDLPVAYQYLDRSQLGRRRSGGNTARKLRQGEGRLVDISYGGASLVVEELLGERGFLQLRFQLHKHPMRMMLEALSCTPMAEGRFLLRGQFRGPGEEARIRLHNTLTREQIKRLREKELLRYTPGG